MATPADIIIDAATVTFGGTNLGSTKGGVTIELDSEYTDVTVDQYGTSILDKRLLGENVTVTVPLAEYTQANIGTVLPFSTNVSGSRKNLGSKPGASLLGQADRLVIRPQSTSGAKDIIIHEAAVEDIDTITLSPEEETLLVATFRGMLDLTRTAGDLLIQFGDSTA